jgi:hypothetical protein
MIFFKNINFFIHNLVVNFTHSQEDEDLINDNFFNIFVLCFLLDVDVFSTNFIVDVIDKFNINLNDDVIYKNSKKFAFFKVFKNNANDVIIINNKIHLIIINDVFIIYFSNNVCIYIQKYSIIAQCSILQIFFYLLLFIVHVILCYFDLHFLFRCSLT